LHPAKYSADQLRLFMLAMGGGKGQDVVRKPVRHLFGIDHEKTDNKTIAQAFRERLRQVAGFSSVPDPLPMRNKKGAIVYYLFFASPKPVAANIVRDIFAKYRDRGAR
jgi:hypothetical protein